MSTRIELDRTAQLGREVMKLFDEVYTMDNFHLALTSACRNGYLLCSREESKEAKELGNYILKGYGKASLFNRGYHNFVRDVTKLAWCLTWADDATADFK